MVARTRSHLLRRPSPLDMQKNLFDSFSLLHVNDVTSSSLDEIRSLDGAVKAYYFCNDTERASNAATFRRNENLALIVHSVHSTL